MNNIPTKLLVVVLLLGLLSGVNFSQSRDTGAIVGTVVDTEGAAIPGANVELSSPDMLGGNRARLAEEGGRFRFVGLQPGVYRLEVSLPGFVTAAREDIRLTMGQTLTITVELSIATIDQEIVVVGIAPLIDVKDSTIAISILDRDFLENIPSSHRRSTYIINQAVGVWDDQAFGAAGRSGNVYTVDGLDTSYPRSGSDWSMVDLNIFKEFQILALGVGAQYDGFEGMIQNMITKSGGNTFSGHAEFIYGGWDWQSKNFSSENPLFALYQAPPKEREIDAGVSLGGPILKDKLWFFSALRWRRDQRKLIGVTEISSIEKPTGFFKLSWQASDKHRISSFFEYDNYFNQRTGLRVTRPPEATWIEKSPVYLYSISGFYTFTDKTFFEYKVNAMHSPLYYEPQKGMEIPGRIDDLTGIYNTNSQDYENRGADRYQVSATLSHYAEEFIKGSHDFKFGVEYEFCPGSNELGYPGGWFYRDNVLVGDIYLTYGYTYHTFNEFHGTRTSAFTQDSWNISDRLTINPGIRLNRYTGNIKALGKNVIDVYTLVPRIGFTWDIFGNHSTALKAHYGRYSSSNKQLYYLNAYSQSEDWVQYLVFPDGSKIEVDRENYSLEAEVNPNIKWPVMDQFTLGIERQLFKDTSLGVSFVWRKWKNFIDRVNSGAQWELYPVTFTDENGVNQTIDVYRRTTPSADDKFYITNPVAGEYSCIETPRAEYLGLIFSFNKRFTQNWMMNASYTLSQTRGTHQGGNTDLLVRNPNDQINSYGPIGSDPTHMFKVYSTIVLPLDIYISPIFEYVTGQPWTRIIRAGSPARNIMIEPRGSNRLDPAINFDLRIEKSFRFGEEKRIGFQFDVFNIINRGIATRVENRVDRDSFGLATLVNPGRRFRIGIRYLF